MAIEATYLEVRNASAALVTLVDKPLGTDKDGNAAPLTLPLRVILKVKRMSGVLGTLVQQAHELEGKLYEAAGLKEGDGIPVETVQQVNELYSVTCEVGSETLSMADFASVDSAQAGLVRVLVSLGPFFVDDALPAADTSQ